MKPTRPAPPTLAELVKAGAAHAPALHVGRAAAAARNTDAQLRMIAKQPASGSANHARHHVSRQTQS